MFNDWKTMYTVKMIPAGLVWLPPSYGIIFDKTMIMQLRSKELANRVASALNGAYNLGREAGLQEGNK